MTDVNPIHAPLILGIDTSQPALGLAVAKGDGILASVVDASGLPHSQRLFPLIAETLENLSLSIAALDLFVVNLGPGSFTGLRVGIAAVKGLAATLGKPLLGINAIDALAFAAKIPSVPVIVMLNASRSEVFCGVRVMRQNRTLQKNEQDRVASFAQLESELKTRFGDKNVVFIGSGATAYWPSLAENKKWKLAEAPPSLAPTIALWANKQGPVEADAAVEAYYIRPSEAEIKLAK